MIKTTPRASLASLPLSKKNVPAATADPPAASDKGGGARESRVSIIVRLTAAERKALRTIAVQQDTTVQAIIEKAVRDVIARDEK
jgi:hypothetical protein